jgi:hypothetical protein
MNKVEMEVRETRSMVEVEIKGKERKTTRNKRQNELRWYELQMRSKYNPIPGANNREDYPLQFEFQQFWPL